MPVEELQVRWVTSKHLDNDRASCVILDRLGAMEASVSWQPPNLAGTELGGCAAFRAWSYRLEMEDSQGASISKRGLQGTRVSLNKSDQLQPASLYKVWLIQTMIVLTSYQGQSGGLLSGRRRTLEQVMEWENIARYRHPSSLESRDWLFCIRGEDTWNILVKWQSSEEDDPARSVCDHRV